jgi:hypothetical protein
MNEALAQLAADKGQSAGALLTFAFACVQVEAGIDSAIGVSQTHLSHIPARLDFHPKPEMRVISMGVISMRPKQMRLRLDLVDWVQVVRTVLQTQFVRKSLQ